MQVPDFFYNSGGSVPISQLMLLILILFSFTFLFDIIFLFLNYFTWQCLPLINTWRRIKKAQVW